MQAMLVCLKWTFKDKDNKANSCNIEVIANFFLQKNIILYTYCLIFSYEFAIRWRTRNARDLLHVLCVKVQVGTFRQL